MEKSIDQELLARLAVSGVHPQSKTSSGANAPKDRDAARNDERLDKLLGRISDLADGADVVKSEPPPSEPRSEPPRPKRPSDSRGKGETDAAAEFLPREPNSFQQAGLSASQVESLALKFLLAIGTTTGRDVAEQVMLPFKLIDDLLAQMKNDQLVFYYASASMNDYSYQLTEMGRERARRQSEQCTYFGAAPVSLRHYIKSVEAQSLTKQHPTADDLRHAFRDLLIHPKMLQRLGPAINSGRGLFLFGAAGNGKTSIAERVTAVFGSRIWIPRSISVDGEIIRVFDPSNHVEAPVERNEGLLEERKIDKRWVRVERPTIVVGGELTMESLEITLNTTTGICEAPLQMKSNCGTLVIDDFGRQKMSIDQLLNRWIVPLEKRYDYLNLCNGKKIQVPFDQLIIFATNLEPRDLVDEAFLRRIPYKIEVTDPSEEDFRELFKIMGKILGIDHQESAIDYLIETHYRKVNRPFRCCQPRDLLTQIRNYCHYINRKPEMTPEFFDFAVENYFAVM